MLLTVQLDPSQRSTSGCVPEPSNRAPTAKHAVADGHPTLVKVNSVAPDGAGTGTVSKRVPFHCWIVPRRAAAPVEKSEYVPTPTHIASPAHDTALSPPVDAPVFMTLHVVPFHRCTSAAPTAMQLDGVAHAIACCTPNGVFGIFANDQAFPLHRPNKVACVVNGEKV